MPIGAFIGVAICNQRCAVCSCSVNINDEGTNGCINHWCSNYKMGLAPRISRRMLKPESALGRNNCCKHLPVRSAHNKVNSVKRRMVFTDRR